MAASPTAPPFETDGAFPLGQSANQCTPVSSSQDDLLDLVERLLPSSSYLDPLKNLGPGFEIFQAMAKVFERLSLAVGRTECDQFFILAEGGERSTGEVEFFRAFPLSGPPPPTVTILPGTIIRTTKGGRQFRVTEQTTLASEFILTPDEIALGATSPILAVAKVEGVADGYEYDVPTELAFANGDIAAGEIDIIELPLYDPPFGDPTIRVRQTRPLGPTAGGHPAALDGLGSNRDITRNPNEGDQDYAARLRLLPDTISPNAIIRQVTRVLEPFGICFKFIETFEVTYQTAYDAPSSPIAENPDYDPNLFTYDDPRPEFPFRNRYLNIEDYRGAFIIVLEDPDTIDDRGMAYDDTTSDTIADHTTAGGGLRATSAYDIPAVSIPPGVRPGFYDMFDIGQAELFLRLFLLLEEIKLGGVLVVLELDRIT